MAKLITSVFYIKIYLNSINCLLYIKYNSKI